MAKDEKTASHQESSFKLHSN